MLAVSTAYWRAECAGFADKIAYTLKDNLVMLSENVHMTYEDSILLTVDELLVFDKEKILPISKEELEKRKCGDFALVPIFKNGEVVAARIITNETTEYARLKALHVPHTHTKKEIFYGTPARRGVVQGIVKIVYKRSDFENFNKGDILVAPETTPAYVPLMRDAKAIVTERGGITSHAAIVSRELGVPCIISAEGVAHILKDGDFVEVDADNGVVRVVSRAD